LDGILHVPNLELAILRLSGKKAGRKDEADRSRSAEPNEALQFGH
jgi:hypothetical protein